MIKRSVFFCSLLFVIALGYAEVQLVDAKIEPTAASAGEKVKGSVEFSGVCGIQKVLIIPREYAYDINQPFAMQKADSCKKELWVLEIMVPYDAPIGPVNLEIKAVDKDSNEIVIKEFAEQQFGKAGLIKFEIK